MARHMVLQNRYGSQKGETSKISRMSKTVYIFIPTREHWKPNNSFKSKRRSGSKWTIKNVRKSAGFFQREGAAQTLNVLGEYNDER